MARILAVEWDSNEFRFVLGFIAQDKLTVIKADAAPIEGGDPDAIISTFSKTMRENRIGGVRTLLALNRAQAEVHYLSLPPASDEELPELVRNQIIRDSSTYTDASALDFVPLNEQIDGPRKVMSAHISRTELKTYRTIFRTVGKNLARIELRTLALNELLSRTTFANDHEPILMVCVGLEDADIVIRYAGQVVSLRSFRLAELADPFESLKRVATEITRTIAVGVPETFDAPIKKVIIFGAEEEAATIGENLADPELEVHPIDPFSIEKVRTKDRPLLPGKYAPLIGMLFTERPGVKPAIDLLAPKESPKPPNYARIVAMLVLLFILIGTGLYLWNRNQLTKMDGELADLTTEYEELVARNKQLAPQFAVLNYARNWDGGGSIWLDELREISALFPSTQDLVVTEMTFTSGPINNNPRFAGMIRFSGIVRDPVVLHQFRAALGQKGFYYMQAPVTTRNPGGGGYPFQFRNATILCGKRPNSGTYLKSLSPELQKDSYNLPEFYPQPVRPPTVQP